MAFYKLGRCALERFLCFSSLKTCQAASFYNFLMLEESRTKVNRDV
ncbi:hypothetical protein APHCRT_0786 [Anaplasma phagocytophilum str. CRT53-1]|uniref:Uncharacterized protein n=1 Tax=Anaplasma phagocytophilum str. CRT53-1 TaxID=1359157 RepID=A0A0F3Q0W2_ANAPH|nr:hypothetical protein APHCRT_0786 [Anaplasma phagocytophilum str. CRT53-1]